MSSQKTVRPAAILAAGACIQLLTGLPAAWGVFQQPVMEEYALEEGTAALAFSVSAFFVLLLPVPMTILTRPAAFLTA